METNNIYNVCKKGNHFRVQNKKSSNKNSKN